MLKITHSVKVAEKAESRRAINVVYRGSPVKVHVGSLREEMELRISAWLKEKAMGEPSPLPALAQRQCCCPSLTCTMAKCRHRLLVHGKLVARSSATS